VGANNFGQYLDNDPIWQYVLRTIRCALTTVAELLLCSIVSIHADRTQQQLSYRREGARDSTQDVLPDGIVIEVLAEIIRANRVQIDQSAIIERLAVRGVGITASQFNQLCTRLDLKKTAGFPS
jgi:hypothetical protein